MKLLSKGAFGYLLPIVSFVLAWLETWFLDFKVLPQEAEETRCECGLQGVQGRAPCPGWERLRSCGHLAVTSQDVDCPGCGICSPGYLAAQAAAARGPPLFSGVLAEGQFYSPPESFAGEGGRQRSGEEEQGLGAFSVFPLGSRGTATPHILELPCLPYPHCRPRSPYCLSSACFPQGLTVNQTRRSRGGEVSLYR